MAARTAPPTTRTKPATAKQPGRRTRAADTDGGQPKQKTTNLVVIGAPNGDKAVKTRQNKGLAEITPPDADGQDADLARETLRAVCRDGTAPAAARAQAARTLAEMAQALGRHAPLTAPAGKPLTQMTREELEAELTRV